MESERNFRSNVPGRLVCFTNDEATRTALCLHQSGSLAEAEIIYQRILESSPQDLNTLHYYGLLCHQQNRHNEAAELIQQIINLDPQNADAYNNLGNVLEGLGRTDDAEHCYRKAIELRPEHAPAYNNLGVILMAQQKTTEAIEAYTHATGLNPESADFQYNLGNALRRSGKYELAAEVYQKAVNLNPEHAGAWQGQAQSLLKAGREDEVEQLFSDWLQNDPGNPIITYLKASCLGDKAPDRAPDAYVEQVFDDMADRFDAHLTENLSYRAPQLVAEALVEILPEPVAKLAVLDAGCGTGLCGDFLRPYAQHLCGVDLSAGMLTKASGRKLYDELRKAELTKYMEQHSAAYELIVSADTLCYFGRLEAVFLAAARALKPSGLFAFTVEDAGEDQDILLTQTGRYAHSRFYVEETLAAAGLKVERIESVVLRSEGKEPVSGHLVVAIKQ